MPENIFKEYLAKFNANYIITCTPERMLITNKNFASYINKYPTTIALTEIDAQFNMLGNIIKAHLYDDVLLCQYDNRFKLQACAKVGINIDGHMKFVKLNELPK